MSWIETKKKQFIKWYYGEFVNDPRADVIMFGNVRPYRAQQLDPYVRFLMKHGKVTGIVTAIVLIGLIVLAVT